MAVTRTQLRRKGATTATAILDATSEIIAEEGVDGFTISDVGRRARVNRALIYHYFGDRQNLVFESIRHIVNKYEQVRPALGADALERDILMHIEHPELARFFFQLILKGQPFPQMSQRLSAAINDIQDYIRQHALGRRFDTEVAVLTSWLTQLAWSCARREVARYLNVSPKDADARFIAYMRQSAENALHMMRNASQ